VFLTLENNQTIAINRIFKSELNIKRVVIPISFANGPKMNCGRNEKKAATEMIVRSLVSIVIH